MKPVGSMETRYASLDMARFPGMEPFGTYPVHIVVKARRHTIAVEDAIVVRSR
jgi:hypothetical protein